MVNTGPLIAEGNENYYALLEKGNFSSPLNRQANIVLNDPYYSVLYSNVLPVSGHSEAVNVLITAGCIDDRLESRIEPDTRFLSSSYSAFKENAKLINPSKTPAVLLSSGSFDPLHAGHVETLLRAREYLDAGNEYEVIGGLLSGGHDRYVRLKNPGGINSHGRHAKNDDFLYRHSANHDPAYGNKPWIFLESMESTFAHQASNFTDVISHVQAMCDRYVSEGVKVFFIFGSDNANFGLTFAHNQTNLAHGICVNRPGYDIEANLKEKFDASSTVHCVNGHSSESSTKVRQNIVAVDDFNRRTMGVQNDSLKTMEWMHSFFADEKEFQKRSSIFSQTLMTTLMQSFDKVIDVSDENKENNGYDDVVCVSDFMLGSTIPPKLHPFVNVSVDSSIMPTLNRDFNQMLWAANVKLFADTGIQVKDMPVEQMDFLEYLGFGKNESIEDIGAYFLARFS